MKLPNLEISLSEMSMHSKKSYFYRFKIKFPEKKYQGRSQILDHGDFITFYIIDRNYLIV